MKRLSSKNTSKQSKLTTTKKFNPKLAGVLAAAMFVIGSVFVLASHAADPYDHSYKAPRGKEAQYQGLKKIKSNSWHHCSGTFELDAPERDAKGRTYCTHGPDQVTDTVANMAKAEKRQAAQTKVKTLPSEQTIEITKQGKAPTDPALVGANDVSTPNSMILGAAPMQFSGTTPTCFGTGRDGKRIVIVALGTPANPINSNDTFFTTIAAQQMETQLIWSSSVKNPNNIKHFRFFQNSATDCNPYIFTANATQNDLTMNGILADPNFSALRNNIFRANASGSNIYHFLIFYKGTGGCGQGNFGANGGYENSTAYGIVWSTCFGTDAPSHELLHTLGAVDSDAPYTSGAAHCTEGNDVMCYGDNGQQDYLTAANGNRMFLSPACDDPSNVQRSYVFHNTFDCNGNDYFDTRADWQSRFIYSKNGTNINIFNVATSGFLSNSAPAPAPAAQPGAK